MTTAASRTRGSAEAQKRNVGTDDGQRLPGWRPDSTLLGKI